MIILSSGSFLPVGIILSHVMLKLARWYLYWTLNLCLVIYFKNLLVLGSIICVKITSNVNLGKNRKKGFGLKLQLDRGDARRIC